MTAQSNRAGRTIARRLASGSATGGALVAALLFAGSAHAAGRESRASRSGAEVARLLAHGQAEEAVTTAERALAQNPHDAALRATLGQAYLHSGRFVSAAAAFNDAVTLGDSSGRTALGLALAQIASGSPREAVATLDRAQTAIPAGDLGLAYALAGESGRGVSLLADAVRGGNATAKLRQNLAYAYALDGRWTEARVTAAVDVPADQIDGRLEQWAMSMRAGAEQDRIAGLLGVSPKTDSGMPVALALNAPAAPAEAAPALATTDANGELPAQAAPSASEAVAAASTPVAPTPAAAAPATAPEQVAVATPAPEAPKPAPVAEAPATAVAATAPAPQAAPAEPAQPSQFAAAFPAEAAPTMVSTPVVQPLPQAPVRHAAATPRAERPAAATPRADRLAVTTPNGDHVVQFGAFASEAGAVRAKAVYARRNPQLAGHDFVITKATVHGRLFWRVAAAGFDASSAQGTCSALRQSGGACFARASAPTQTMYAARPVPAQKLATRR